MATQLTDKVAKKVPKDPYNKKISILVPMPLYNRMTNCLEWGERNKVFLRVFEWVVEKIEKHGVEALALLLREDDMQKLVDMGISRQSKPQPAEEGAEDGND